MLKSELVPYEDPIDQASGNSNIEAVSMLEKARAIEVKDQESLSVMNELLLRATAWLKRCDEEFGPGIKDAHDLHKRLVAKKKEWEAPAIEAREIARPKVARYLAEEDERRRQIEREAELKRQMAKKEAEDASDVAHELIHEGRLDEAEEIFDTQAERIEAIQAAVPAIPEKPKAPGTSLVRRWSWDRSRVNMELVPREFLRLDEEKITRYVQTMKWDAKIPGIRIMEVADVSTRARR